MNEYFSEWKNRIMHFEQDLSHSAKINRCKHNGHNIIVESENMEKILAKR